MIAWDKVQTKLAKRGLYSGKVDNSAGRLTYTGVLTVIATKPSSLMSGVAVSLAVNAPSYDVDQRPKRLADFLGQSCVESAGFTLLREIWGPTAAQKLYDTALGNRPGDGYKMRGAGLIEVTGRYWFDKIGHNLGLDLVGNPDKANDPNVAVLISLEWWKLNNMNSVSDLRDTLAVSRAVNRGNPNSTRTPLAFGDRVDATNRGLELLS